MPRTPRFCPLRTPRGWCVNTPATLTASGRRERQYFKTRDAAKIAAQELREKFMELGANATAIKPSLAEDATKAAAVLEPWGVSLLDAARTYVFTKEREAESCPVNEATAAFLVSCEGLRQRTYDAYRQVCTRLDSALGDRLLASLNADDVVAAADLGRSGAAAANRYRCARAFWRWAGKKGWCDIETFGSIETPRTSGDTEITVLEVAEAEALLDVAEKHFPQAVASYALQLFAGLRVEEVARIEARHVSADGIDLPARVTKKNRRRHITPSPTMQAWLERYPFEPCPNWRNVHNACRRLAGWDVAAGLLKRRAPNLPPAKRGSWPQNVLRHSFASYAIAAGATLEEMLFTFGHSGGPALLRSNYVGRVTKKAALEYFALRPGGMRVPARLEPVEGAA